MKKYYVYILSCSDSSYYIGITNDVFERELQHNQGTDTKAYTFTRRPVQLVWYQDFLNPEEAIAREKQLKGWSRKKKQALINGDYDLLPKLAENSLRQAQTDNDWIITKLPYTRPFLFVDALNHIDENSVEGTYTFNKELDFYTGHFKGFPVTPGVILTECCAQIGVVSLGIYLLGDENSFDGKKLNIAMSSSEMEFYLPVFPGEMVKVTSSKVYFRFNKLKCEVKMFNAANKLVCKGVLAGMLKTNEDGK
ncbi:GIY-YIG nuclease family protein [Flagellimonas sp.]|uniref:GIY-YIG nuclease family protein n=1 Tax=Flagellimonas sp. TaxID=2058762 RepID=UPI003B58D738